MLLSYENTNIEKVLEADLDRPAVKLLGGASNKKNLLVLRNPFNMLPSAEKMLRRTRPALENDEQLLRNALDRRLNLWKSYAFLHMHPMSVTRGKFETFLFDRWVIEKGYRDSMAEKLGYKNKDLFIDFVSDAGKGSSFSGVSLAQKEDVLRRWSESNAVAIEVLSKHPEVIGFTALIFGEDAVPKQYLTVK
ncbi:hypothetical protein [Plastorhodobacter daqingensis]|uniref:hypothetical protein n=1 Tax=Plastorhodobacter daqingensis TaxID=1387281 RepID=UPI00366DD0EC